LTSTRARVALYAAAGVAGVALVSSTFVLTRQGIPLGAAAGAAVPLSIAFAFIGLASRYPCRVLPLRSSQATRLIVAHGGGAAVASAVWTFAWQRWLTFLGHPADTGFLFGVAAILYGATVMVHYLNLEVETSREAEEAALRYRLLAREAELKAFKAQIDPHFLFNSLNAVAALCGTRPADARSMAQLLADFFRQTLRLGGQDRITLGEELDLVARYLKIENVRFGTRLGVLIDAQDAARACTVPPLLLQPLVENAVRHGLASTVEGGTIEVAASVAEGRLHIRIDNPADPDRADERGEGIGLQNARGRLAAFSGGEASLRTTEADGRYRVEIELPS
jgi:two-component system sensor histidine kinase AlgZ